MGALIVEVTETVKTEILIKGEIMKKFPIGMLANTIGEDISKRYSFESHTSQIQYAIFEGLQKFQQSKEEFLVNVFDRYTLKIAPSGGVDCILSLIENTVVIK